MASTNLVLALSAALLVSASAFTGTSVVMKPRHSMGLSVSRRISPPAPLSLRMEATEEVVVKVKVGSKAEMFSKSFAHPKAIAGDSEIRKILPHRYAEACAFPYLVFSPCVRRDELSFHHSLSDIEISM